VRQNKREREERGRFNIGFGAKDDHRRRIMASI